MQKKSKGEMTTSYIANITCTTCSGVGSEGRSRSDIGLG